MSAQLPYSPYLQPAQLTQLAKQGSDMLPRYWVPNRGLVLRSSLPMLPTDACTIAQNVRWNGITWTTQGIGWTQQRSTPFGNGVIVEMAVHFNAQGQQIYVHQAGTQVQTYDPTQTVTGETTLFTASQNTIPCMRSFSPNFFLYVNGIDQPQYWNGVATSGNWLPLPVGGVGSGQLWPLNVNGQGYASPAIVEVFNNRAVFAGFSGDPFAIVISNFGDPSTITITNVNNQATYGGIYNVPSALGPVTSLKSLQVALTSNQQVLLVGCQNGFAIIAGTDATNFTLVSVQSNKWGIPSNRAWLTIDTNAYALCTDGIRPFNGNAYLTNLVTNALSYPVHPLVVGWNSNSQGAQAFCLDNPDQLEATYYFCSGIADQLNRTALVMSYADLASGPLRFSTKLFPSLAAMPTTFYSPACGVRFKGQYFCGGFDGILQQMYVSSTFNGTGANYLIGSPLFAPPTPSQEASVRGFWIITEGLSTQFTATAYGWIPSAAASQQLIRTKLLSQNISVSVPGSTALGQTFTLGSAQFAHPQYNISPFNAPGGSRAFEFQISGSTSNGDLDLVGVFGTLIGGGTSQ